jgi:8-oxo-dGTP pyrophosphatase MutT (NUDIX family)
VLHAQPGPFVPAGADLDDVERRWSALCAANPAYFDGRIWHVLGVHRNGHGGAAIHVVDCAYRFHAVQRGGRDLGVRPLGVKGMVRRGADGRVLVARRSRHVAAYEGMWEFAPAGVVESGGDPARTILAELGEEVGMQSIGEPIALAILFDDVIHTWEVVYRLNVATDEVTIEPREYDAFEWCDAGDLPADLTPIARAMTSLL